MNPWHVKLLRNSVTWKTCQLCGRGPPFSYSRWKSSSSHYKPKYDTSETTDLDGSNDIIRKKISFGYKENKITSTNFNIKIRDINSSTNLTSLSELPILHDAQGSVVVVLQSQPDKSNSSPKFTTISQQEIVCDKKLLEKTKYIIKSSGEELEPYSEDVEVLADPTLNRIQTRLSSTSRQETIEWKPQKINPSQLPSVYASLAKSRLTGLVVLTAVAGYLMAPAPLDPVTLACCTVGIALVSSSANTINQFLEVPYDSQMDRTKNRVLVQGKISPLHAFSFGAVSGVTGIAILLQGASPLTASLGVVNLLLYTSVYTPMKRLSIANTWVGSVVGAIPPLIGWSGCTGGLEPGAWIMAAILFAWQFPHFNALSWNLRKDYSRAGYRMMSVVNPDLCRRTALSYSLLMIGICTAAPILDVTTWTFAADSLPLNLYLSYLGWKFYKEGDSKSSRKLFGFSLIHLPAVLVLMIISKKRSGKEKSTPSVQESLKNAPLSELAKSL